MNERILQFRIGMFVIVAGLVLTMMIVWFEAPALIRERQYVTVFFREAPGINEGIPVRKSGVRIGEVFNFRFTPPEDPVEGVLVTLSIDPRYSIRTGSIPKLSRALIGDVSIDMLPGDGEGPMPLFASPEEASKPGNRIEGLVATDPFVLLTGASKIFEQADGTLASIEAAATNLAEVTKKLDNIDEFVETWTSTGKRVETLATNIDQVITENGPDIKPAVQNIRSVAKKVDDLLNDDNRQRIEESLEELRKSFARLDRVLEEFEPVARDLGAGPGEATTTNIGQSLTRLNRVIYELSLLTGELSDAQGKLNRNGTLQRLVSDPELYNEIRSLARSADTTIGEARTVLNYLKQFAEKISRNPSVISQGVLSPR